MVYRNNAIPTPVTPRARATPLFKAAVLVDPDVPVIEGPLTLSVEEDRVLVGVLLAMRLSLPPEGEEAAVAETFCVPEVAALVPAAVDEVTVPASILIAGRSNPVHESLYAETKNSATRLNGKTEKSSTISEQVRCFDRPC